jgi:4-amino-4-deoxy-L-arabinose transferase-like glycosyltransferase
MKNRSLHLLAVTAVALALLGYGIQHASVGMAYSDPIAKLRAQDESVYAHMSMRIARTGGWLTPKLLGRYLFSKPPLLTWLTALSLKLLGTSLFALRLPALAAAVFCTTVVFWLAARVRPPDAAWAVAALLLSNSLWQIFARLCYTDMLLAGCMAGALAIVYRDPRLERAQSLGGFAACCAAGVMVKNAAGLLPVFVLVVYLVLADRSRRPNAGRVALAIAILAALVAPWHVYQLLAHRQWFWADYVQMQLLGFGFDPPNQTSAESQIEFYAKRLILSDPVLLVLLAVAAPLLLREVRRRAETMPALIFAWLSVTTIALLLFRYRNLPYALYLIPPACLASVLYSPLFSPRWAKVSLAALCVVFGLKCYWNGQPWGISLGVAKSLPAVATLRSYYDLARPNELILVNADDDLYAVALPLPRIRYYFLDPRNLPVKYQPYYATLGITLTVDEFDRLDQLEPVYAARLKAWGLDSVEPIGTTIVSSSWDALPRLAQAHRNADFYVTEKDWLRLERETPIDRTHIAVKVANNRELLLARDSEGTTTDRQPLPALW